MDADRALVRLQNMVQSSVEPVLSSNDLADLLSMAAVIDANGKAPVEVGWIAAYSANGLNAAAAEGWRWKAAKLGEGETFMGADRARFEPEVRRKFCMDQADVYRKKVIGTLALTGRTSQRLGIGVGDDWEL